MEAEAVVPLQPRTGTLLCLNLPDPALATIRACGYRVAVNNISGLSEHSIHLEPAPANIVLLDVTAGGQDKIEIARRVRSAICMSGSSAALLCFSAAHRNARFVLELTKCGARYVRISDFAMLIEAIEILVAEAVLIKRMGPSFRILHRFSHDFCAPGEEIAAIELTRNGDFFQLPLALSGRFVFDCLAGNRSIALDAFQIASGLNGRFYREHALNNGIRQTTRVRIATVKVLVQRIRQAMASTFARAELACDPYEVLRSFSAEGSRRALYRLRAEIRWEHQFQ